MPDFYVARSSRLFRPNLSDFSHGLPDVRIFVARTEVQGLEDMRLGFFGATDENLT